MAILEEDTVAIVTQPPVVEIFINRAESLNALNVDVLQGLILAFEKVQLDPKLRAIILSGNSDKAFVAGADIHGMADLGPRPIADYVELGQRTMRVIEKCRVPVIAAVNGYALGGGLELALACDIIIAADTAKLGQPEVNLGIIPGFGGTQRLIQRCGIGTARRLVLTGDLIGAEEALRLGLVDKVVPRGEILTEVRKMGEAITKKAPLAVNEAKRVLRESQEAALLSGLRLEVESFLKLFATSDRAEGMAAFMEKREATFSGK